MQSRRFLLLTYLAAAVLFVPGCERKDRESPPRDAAANVVCPQLYQESGSLTEALAFVEVPDGRMASSLASVSKRGEQLADSRQLTFANRLFSLRKTKDVELFKSLLSDDTRKQLDEPDSNQQMVRYCLREVEGGMFLYGQWDFKFFAAFRTLTQNDLDTLSAGVRFAQAPTHAITFYHFHKPKPMLIGTCFHLIQDGDSYRLVTETLRKDGAPAAAAM